MCGICGFVTKKSISERQLQLMNDTMYHRGPDDSGVELYEGRNGYTVGFAHRRLSILDLSQNGHQPMHSRDGRVSVVFNGEIYNYPELKRELRDYPYSSSCDTEVIIAAYLRWGIGAVERIHGMFAIAIYDRETDELFLIRDRIGKKPLYYAVDGEDLVFASELKPLMACPTLSLQINTDVIPRYIYRQYIHGPESIFKNVWKLEPGGILRFRGGKITKWKYWDIARVYKKMSSSPVTDFSQAREELKELLNRSVASRMIADVPIGTFLSGGYDSSLITAIAQSQSSKPVKSFCMGFHEKQCNEAEYAKQIARYLGTDHTEVYLGESELYDMVRSIPRYYDEPFADASQIPSMLISQIARGSVTVALSGDGGDEFFCGYDRYEFVRQAQLLNIPGAVVHAVGSIPLGGGRLIDLMPFKLRVLADNRNPLTRTQVFSDSYALESERFLSEEARASGGVLPVKYPVEDRYDEKNWQIKAMLLDMDTYLPDDILVKMDRASMKYSLENRCPLLDTAVMEYSFRIPQRFKYRSGDKKHILKSLAYDYIPRVMLDRPKQGFGVPLDAWLRGALKEALIDFSRKEYLEKQGIFDGGYVPGFVDRYLQAGDGGPATGRNYSRLIWSFYVFQQWYEFYMTRA